LNHFGVVIGAVGDADTPFQKGADTGETPAVPTTDTGEALFVITPSGRRYHLPSCGSARNIGRHLSKDEAEQLGYTPCGTCKPG
jgi:hypothetical protein